MWLSTCTPLPLSVFSSSIVMLHLFSSATLGLCCWVDERCARDHMHKWTCVQPTYKKTGLLSTQTQPQQAMWSLPGWWSGYGMITKDNLCSQSGKIAQIEARRTIHWPVYWTLIAERFTSTIHLLGLQQPHTSRQLVPPIYPDFNDRTMCSDSSHIEMNSIQCPKWHENV